MNTTSPLALVVTLSLCALNPSQPQQTWRVDADRVRYGTVRCGCGCAVLCALYRRGFAGWLVPESSIHLRVVMHVYLYVRESQVAVATQDVLLRLSLVAWDSGRVAPEPLFGKPCLSGGLEVWYGFTGPGGLLAWIRLGLTREYRIEGW
ncbi:hypothetical protein F5B21DRAFT_239791 [Xylaria acuta]|nr:hypothetical protein F5B21DRAFT_239791 [Xylaria acuta]